MSESDDTEAVTKTITNLLLKHSYSLSSPGSNRNRKRKHGVLKLHALSSKLPSISGNRINFLSVALCMITICQNAKIFVWLCVTS